MAPDRWSVAGVCLAHHFYREAILIDPKQGPLYHPGKQDHEIDYLQAKTGKTRAAILAVIKRVGHSRQKVLAELRKG